jgi:hypothetical protein
MMEARSISIPAHPDAPLVTVVSYDPARHYAALCTWWEGHGREPEPQWALPDVGVVAVASDGEGLACCFAHAMDRTGIWFLDYFTSNPAADKRAVNRGCDAALMALEAHIRAAGGRCAGAITPELAVVQRVRRMGWKVRGRHWFFIGKALGSM